VPRCSAWNPFGVGRGLAVPLGHSNEGGQAPDPFADVDATSQKKPAAQGCAKPKTSSRISFEPVPAKQNVPGLQAYGRNVVSFLNGSDVFVPLWQ
jgi:hypothetical protein